MRIISGSDQITPLLKQQDLDIFFFIRLLFFLGRGETTFEDYCCLKFTKYMYTIESNRGKEVELHKIFLQDLCIHL